MENNNQEKLIKDAQYRKGLSIAYFNSLNAAIELAVAKGINQDDLREFITKWRDWFLDEHTKYYAETIAKIGLNFDVKETLKKLESIKSLESLKSVWLSLSADERQNTKVVEAKNKLKVKYEKTR